MHPAELDETDAGVAEACATARVALTARHFPGLRPVFRVEDGAQVAAGDIVFAERRRPAIGFAAPAAGRVERLNLGPRRTLGALVLTANAAADAEAAPPAGDLREVLLARGLWPAFRARPYGRIPDPDSRPDAIFVLALHPGSDAPDPAAVIAPEAARFAAASARVAELTDGPLWLCQGEGPSLVPERGRVRISRAGRRPADALAASHLHRHHSVADGGMVWTISYADVLTIGRLLETGRYDPRRVVRICGPLASRPREVSLLLGADLQEIARAEARPDARGLRIRAGPSEGGLAAGLNAAWLGPNDLTVTLDEACPPRRDGGVTWLGRPAEPGPRPIVPTDRLDAALPRGIHAVPLMRALAVADAERARRLGALDLLEDDVALISTLCASGMDYRPLLRAVLDQLEADA